MDVKLVAFLISLVAAALLAGPLTGVLRRHAGAFYAVAAILTVAYVTADIAGVSPGSLRPLFVVMQKGYLAAILLGVVMFTGCFDEGTKIRRHLQPVRGELSILSFLFFLGHIITYLPNYLVRFPALAATKPSIATSVIIAIVLTVIFLALGITSFKAVRKLMSRQGWKNLQRLSYLMMALLALHIGLVLGRSVFAGGAGTSLALVSFVAYEVILAAYAALRMRKALRDRTRRQQRQAQAARAE